MKASDVSEGTAGQPLGSTRQEIEAGGWRITTLFDAYFRLDGGAMWGVVPKNLWAPMERH